MASSPRLLEVRCGSFKDKYIQGDSREEASSVGCNSIGPCEEMSFYVFVHNSKECLPNEGYLNLQIAEG